MDRRVGKTKTAIRNAYLELLRTRQNKKITISEIARLADIDRKTFYLHYETPDDILNEIYETEVHRALEELRSRGPRTDAAAAVADLFEVLTAMIAEHLEIFELLTERNADNGFFEKIRGNLVELIRTEYRETFGMTETEYQIYADFFLSGIISVYGLWIKKKLPVRIDALAEMVTRASLTGLEGLIK